MQLLQAHRCGGQSDGYQRGEGMGGLVKRLGDEEVHIGSYRIAMGM